MYIENVTELAFDDITPEDRDFSSIQGEKSFLYLGYYLTRFIHCCFLPSWIFSGLAEAGLISSKLSRQDLLSAIDHEPNSPFCFSPERYRCLTIFTRISDESL